MSTFSSQIKFIYPKSKDLKSEMSFLDKIFFKFLIISNKFPFKSHLEKQ